MTPYSANASVICAFSLACADAAMIAASAVDRAIIPNSQTLCSCFKLSRRGDAVWYSSGCPVATAAANDAGMSMCPCS